MRKLRMLGVLAILALTTMAMRPIPAGGDATCSGKCTSDAWCVRCYGAGSTCLKLIGSCNI